MPKLSEIVLASCKKFNHHKPIRMKYRVWMPLVLSENKILETKDPILKERPCTEEIKNLLTCFKHNEFDESLCSKEVLSLTKCMEVSAKKREEIKKTGSKAHNVNKMLAKYPIPKVTLKLKGEK